MAMFGTVIFAGISLAGGICGRPSVVALPRGIFIRSTAADGVPTAQDRRVRSLYEVLRVRETATAREIKAAYRSLAKRFHPDVESGEAGGGDEFLEIHRAYEALSDPAARARYDLSIGKWRRGSPGRKGSGPAGGRRTSAGSRPAHGGP